MKNYIDRTSFILGMITAFGECVSGEAKRLALSPPFPADSLQALQKEAEKIAAEQGIQLYLDLNEDIPKAQRTLWWALYKFEEDLDWYLKLRKEGFNPAWDFQKFKTLLGYGFVWGENADDVTPRMRRETDCMDPVKRILFPNGGWPIPKP